MEGALSTSAHSQYFIFFKCFSPFNFNILAAGGPWKASRSYDAGSPSFHLLAYITRKLKYILKITFLMKPITTDAARFSHEHKRLHVNISVKVKLIWKVGNPCLLGSFISSTH